MKYLNSDPKICGGDLVIKGTRISISVIFHRLKDGHSLEDIHDIYPQLSISTLKGAIEEAISLLEKPHHV